MNVISNATIFRAIVMLACFVGMCAINVCNSYEDEEYYHVYECRVALNELTVLDENENYTEIVTVGRRKIAEGVKDRAIYLILAKAYYLTSDTVNSEGMLMAALDKNYVCYVPRGECAVARDEAIIYYHLSEIYGDRKLLNQSKYFLDKALGLMKVSCSINQKKIFKLFNKISWKNNPGDKGDNP